MPELPSLLWAFAARFGTRNAIRDSPDPDVRAEAKALERAGLRHYRSFHGNVRELATTSVQQTLQAAGTSRVTAAVYTSDTFATATPTKEMRTLLLATGLEAVDSTVIAGRGCDNLSLAAAAAEARLHAGASDVLMVTSDQVTRGTRLNPDARTVMSDGAASCLISWESIGPAFHILATSALSISPPVGAPPLLRARCHVSAIRALSSQVFELAGLDPARCTTGVTSNVGLGVAHMLRSAAGVAHAPLYRPVSADIGHCFAADGIHTLGLLLRERNTMAGDLVLVIATSLYSCSLMLLRVAATSAPGAPAPHL
ncbi:hypothetical protein ACWGQL_34840 [Streptomyces lydicus]